MSAVADEVGYSRRHLSTLVRASPASAPSSCSAWAGSSPRGRCWGATLARIAPACGYADQAHLTREWV